VDAVSGAEHHTAEDTGEADYGRLLDAVAMRKVVVRPEGLEPGGYRVLPGISGGLIVLSIPAYEDLMRASPARGGFAFGSMIRKRAEGGGVRGHDQTLSRGI
jgi:hypothetical protein